MWKGVSYLAKKRVARRSRLLVFLKISHKAFASKHCSVSFCSVVVKQLHPGKIWQPRQEELVLTFLWSQTVSSLHPCAVCPDSRLSVSTTPHSAVSVAEVFFLTVHFLRSAEMNNDKLLEHNNMWQSVLLLQSRSFHFVAACHTKLWCNTKECKEGWAFGRRVLTIDSYMFGDFSAHKVCCLTG